MPHRDYYLPERRLISQDNAALIARPDVPRSRFINQWSRKTSFDAGYLVPFLVDEVYPGDHMRYNVTAYVRMSTPLFPMFDEQRVDTFFFYCPNRLVWDNWVKQQGEQDNPTDSIAFLTPVVTGPAGGYQPGWVADHFGIPTSEQVAVTFDVNALPFRMYNLIYNQWFRDQNIQNSVVVPKTDGPDNPANYQLLRRAKSHDYFTSALPWPQKFTAPTIPLGGLAPVVGIGAVNAGAGGALASVRQTGGLQSTFNNHLISNSGLAGTGLIAMDWDIGTGFPKVYADLGAASAITINVLRQAWMIQSLLEAQARGGTRYVENIRNLFGVTNPDFRLQRAEYIGGGQSPLQITPIAQTAPSTGVPVGALGAAGTSSGHHSASYAATEHGFIIGLINIRSELSYQQGLNKMWLRRTQADYYVPQLAGLGEQAILRREIYLTGNAGLDGLVFGYQERWHELRTRTSEVTGKFKSGIAGTLDAWHLAQRFTVAPTLSSAFIVDDPPMARVLAAGALAVDQQYLADILIERNAVRPIPMHGTPITMGRF